MSVNKAMILGRLGKDPVLKQTSKGVSTCSFSVATSEAWVDRNGDKQEKTEWHNIIVFSKVAEACARNLKKGSQVFIEGKIQTRTYEKDGSTHYITEINAQRVEFLTGKYIPEERTDSQNDFKFDPPIPSFKDEHNDLPF